MKNIKTLFRNTSSLSSLRKAKRAIHAKLSQSELERGYFSSRVYQDKTLTELLNQVVMNTSVQSPLLVDNADKIYDITRKILGNNLSSSVIKKTVGRVFTGGSTFEEVLVPTAAYNRQGIPVFIDYVAEASAHHNPTNEEMDYFTSCFCESVLLAAKTPGNGISIKFSPLVDYLTLKKANAAQRLFVEFFDEAYNGDLQANEASLEDLFNVMKKSITTLEKQTFLEYIKETFNKDVDSVTSEQKISRFDWRLNTHVYDINCPSTPVKPLVQLVAGFEEKDLQELKKFTERLNKIFSLAKEYNIEALCDAEQSYVQYMIDSITEQFSVRYNEDNPIVVNTVQNYLKSSRKRVEFEFEKCEKLKLNFALKMVRGAYMVEENKLARAEGRPSPIFESVEKTHDNYDSNVEYLISKLNGKSQVYVCSHNEKSVLKTIDMIQSRSIDKKNGKYRAVLENFISKIGGVKFAQLMGLGEHLTMYLNKMGFNVYKYIAFGPTEIMIPFLIRRAQESKQMIAGSKLQQRLLHDELKRRLF